MQDFASIGEAARRTGLSEATIRRLIDKGTLKAERLTQHRNMRLIDRADLERFVEEREGNGAISAVGKSQQGGK